MPNVSQLYMKTQLKKQTYGCFKEDAQKSDLGLSNFVQCSTASRVRSGFPEAGGTGQTYVQVGAETNPDDFVAGEKD